MAELIDQAMTFAHAEEAKEAVQPIFDAAESYIINTMEQKDKALNEKNPVFCLAVEMLFAHWHDNREPIGSASKIAYGLECLITQLQTLGGDDDAGGGTESTG